MVEKALCRECGKPLDNKNQIKGFPKYYYCMNCKGNVEGVKKKMVVEVG